MIAYLAPEKLDVILKRELGAPCSQLGRLFLLDQKISPSQNPLWVDQTWLNPERISITSIGDAVKKLKDRNFLWANYSFDHHRRSQLIQEQLPKLKEASLQFLEKRIPQREIGSWCLIHPNELLCSKNTSSPPFPLGSIQFQETKDAPSRAYLKLWEAFTIHMATPKPGSRVLDLGSSPGGWSWVLSTLNCEVVSVDRAELDPRLKNHHNIKFIKRDAFSLTPESVGPVDWLFSDIICYPPKLLELVQKWHQSGLVRNFLCTIKFQNETDFSSIEKFRQIPDSRLVHLYNNKHELTWVLQRD